MNRACRDVSLETGESLAGTAIEETTRWLLLELPGPWAAKPLMSPGISDTLRAHIQSVLDSAHGTRLQLIRPTGPSGASLRLLVVRSGVGTGWVHDVRLDELAALPTVDIAMLWETEPDTPARSLILVCTHGMRDRCCARMGVPVANALTALKPDQVMQTSHLGGHRFAATAVVLPAGIHLGRLAPGEAGALLDAIDAGRIHRMDRYRGCTALRRTAQAAEAFLREREGIMALDAVTYLGGHALDAECVEERFQTPAGEVRVWVEAGPPGAPRLKRCGAEELSCPESLRCRPAGS